MFLYSSEAYYNLEQVEFVARVIVLNEYVI